MRTIIAGSRDITDERYVVKAITLSKFEITSVVCGGARGVDTIGRVLAEKHGVPVAMFKADWDTHGKKAGYLRNEQMALNADALIAVWDGVSKGTKHMIDLAKKHNLQVYVHILEGNGGNQCCSV